MTWLVFENRNFNALNLPFKNIIIAAQGSNVLARKTLHLWLMAAGRKKKLMWHGREK